MTQNFFFHESSYIDEGAIIGKETKIWHFCHIMAGAQIGNNCNIGQNVFIAPEVYIGNNVKIQNNVSLYSGVVIEDDVFLGPSIVFTNVMNPRSHVNRKNEYRKTILRKGSTVGANATIVCGVVLGNYCFIGAGSVVTKNIPDYALYYGNPAIFKGWICNCGIQLISESEEKQHFKCPSCGEKYQLINKNLIPISGGNK